MLYINDDLDGFDLDRALPLLSEQRRGVCLRFRHELGRKQCAAAYLLLRKALLEEYGISEMPVFGYGEHGKPFIIGHPDIHFNISHCHEAVVCAVSDKPVGVDVESIDRYKESVAQYTMNDREMDIIHSADNPALAFTCLWTMKEALLKLSGQGISNDMRDVLTGDEPITTVEELCKGYVYSWIT